MYRAEFVLMPNIDEIMSRDLKTCEADDTLELAARGMWDGDVGAMPVIDSLGCPIGVITDRDIAMAAYTQGRPLSQLTVRSAMSDGVHVLGENAKLDDVQTMMQRHHIRRLPVVDRQGQIVGIVTLSDLARCAGPSPKAGITVADIVHTLRTVSEPRSEQPRALAAQ